MRAFFDEDAGMPVVALVARRETVLVLLTLHEPGGMPLANVEVATSRAKETSFTIRTRSPRRASSMGRASRGRRKTASSAQTWSVSASPAARRTGSIGA